MALSSLVVEIYTDTVITKVRLFASRSPYLSLHCVVMPIGKTVASMDDGH